MTTTSSTAAYPRIQIAAPLQRQFREQIASAQIDSIKAEPKSAKLERNFKEFLQSTEITNSEFYHTADWYITQLKQHAANFDRDLPSRLFEEKANTSEDRNIEAFGNKGKANLIKLLIKYNLLFHPKQIALLSDKNRDLMVNAITKMPEDDLIENLRHLNLDDNLNKLAELLMKRYQNDTRAIQDTLEIAYGTERSLSDALSEDDASAVTKNPSYSVRSNLQSLLLEVIKLDSNSDSDKFIDLYTNAKEDPDRTDIAKLIKEKFPEQAVEIFQGLAMAPLEEHPLSQEINLRKHAIREYANMNAKNCTKTLMGIATSLRHPEIIYQTLVELFKRDDFNLDEIFKAINRAIDENKASSILFTLLKFDPASMTTPIKKAGVKAINFFQTLMAKVPELAKALDAIDSDFTLQEHATDLGQEPAESWKQEQTNEPSFNIINWITNKFSIGSIVKEFLAPHSNEIVQNNAMHLLSRIKNQDMIAFHKAGKWNSDTAETSRNFAQNLGLSTTATQTATAAYYPSTKLTRENRLPPEHQL